MKKISESTVVAALRSAAHIVARPVTQDEITAAKATLMSGKEMANTGEVRKVFGSAVAYGSRDCAPKKSDPVEHWARTPSRLERASAFVDGFLERMVTTSASSDNRTDSSRYEEAVKVGPMFETVVSELLPDEIDAVAKRLGYKFGNTVDPREIERVTEIVVRDASRSRELELDALVPRSHAKRAQLLERYERAVKHDGAFKPVWGQGQAPELQKLARDLVSLLTSLKSARLQSKFYDADGNLLRTLPESLE